MKRKRASRDHQMGGCEVGTSGFPPRFPATPLGAMNGKWGKCLNPESDVVVTTGKEWYELGSDYVLRKVV